MRWPSLLLLLVLLPVVYGEELTEEFEKDYISVSYVTIAGDPLFEHADTDGDGMDDAVVVLDTATGKVRIIKFGTSEVYKQFTVPVSNSYALGVIKLSGSPSVIIVGSKYLSAYTPDGELLWEKRDLPGSVYSIAVADLDGDGRENEIVAGLWEVVVAYSSGGSSLWEMSISDRGDKLVSLDLDRDGVKESLALAESSTLYLISADGRVIERFGSEYFKNRIIKLEAVDLDGDGYTSELIVFDIKGTVYAINQSGMLWESEVYYEPGSRVRILQLDTDRGTVYIYSSFIYRFSSEGVKQTYYKGVPNDVVAVDFNGDGRKEGFAGASDNKIYAIKGGVQVGYYEQNGKKVSPYNSTGARTMTTFDYDGDGVLDDLLVVNTDNQLLIVSHIKSQVSGKIIVLANLIDYGLAADLFEYLRNAGYDVVHVLPGNFNSYRSEKNIIILGGHRAYDGVGDIVGDLLSAQQKAELEQKGAVKMFSFSDIWAPGQRIIVLAGNTREETRQAHRKHRGELVF